MGRERAASTADLTADRADEIGVDPAFLGSGVSTAGLAIALLAFVARCRDASAIDRIYCSPLSRAQSAPRTSRPIQSAAAIALPWGSRTSWRG